jgi:hypothetical protein
MVREDFVIKYKTQWLNVLLFVLKGSIEWEHIMEAVGIVLHSVLQLYSILCYSCTSFCFTVVLHSVLQLYFILCYSCTSFCVTIVLRCVKLYFIMCYNCTSFCVTIYFILCHSCTSFCVTIVLHCVTIVLHSVLQLYFIVLQLYFILCYNIQKNILYIAILLNEYNSPAKFSSSLRTHTLLSTENLSY